jgi:hypothetical protein
LIQTRPHPRADSFPKRGKIASVEEVKNYGCEFDRAIAASGRF